MKITVTDISWTYSWTYLAEMNCILDAQLCMFE